MPAENFLNRYIRRLTFAFLACLICPAPSFALDTVRLTIERIRVIDGSPDSDGGEADFFVRWQIAGARSHNEDRGNQDSLEGMNEIMPRWEFTQDVDRNVAGTIPIQIEVWDEDGFLNGADDQLDASSSPSTRVVALSLNLATCVITLGPNSGVFASSTTTTLITTGACGQLLSVSGDGTPESEARVYLEFRVTRESDIRPDSAIAGTAPRIRCTHAPLIPVTGEPIVITASSVNATGGAILAEQFNIFFASALGVNAPTSMPATPAGVCSVGATGTTTCAITQTVPVGSAAFSYGCSTTVAGLDAWSGWKTAPIGLTADDDPIPVVRTGSSESRIDIVFAPDRNSYPDISGRAFQNDVAAAILNGYYSEDIFLMNQDHFNFWIAQQPGLVSDFTASDCDHEPPSDWSDNYGFADLGVIMHTWDRPAGAPAFRDCAPGGESYVSSPAGAPRTLLHETGHTPFGLADEYCCDGGYFEAEPANIYSEWGNDLTEDCRADLANLGRTTGCRLVDVGAGTIIGTGPFSNFHSTSEPPSNDLMNDNRTPQAADIRSFNEMFTRCRNTSC